MTNSQVERQQVPVRFADLRQLATSVPSYLARKVGVKGTPVLSTASEDDFEIGGLDTESLLLAFGADYHVDLMEFDFTSFSSEEPGVGDDLLFFPKLLLFLGCWLGKTIVALLVWPISALRARRIWVLPTLSFWFPARFPPAKRLPSEVLTVGDFVASAALGRFVKREQVCFIVAKSNPANNHWVAG